MTLRRRELVLTSFFLFFVSFSLLAERPSQRNQQAIIAGRIQPDVKAFVASCFSPSKPAIPIALYSQGAWFVITDLAQHVKDQGNDDDGTALVWLQNGRPRAVSQWIHDDEFDRHTLACLDRAGVITRLVSTYMPGLSEPELHWCFVHSFILSTSQRNSRAVSIHYTDWNGNWITPPKLTSEDRDFIAGERQYTKWRDFDFADAFTHNP